MESSYEKLMKAIFGELADSAFIDYPYLVGDTSVLLDEIFRESRRHGDLSPREQRVLLLRFGLDNGKAKTLEAVGREFNVQQERIRQIEAKALRKLRHPYHVRRLKSILYKPTQDDRRSIAMRRRLFDELGKLFPENITHEMVMGIKRPYLKRALRDLTRGNVAEQVRLSCGLALRYCRNCGAVTLPNWDFCSEECHRAYQNIKVVCDNCGTEFRRRDKVVVHRLGKLGYQRQFCTKRCLGQYAGRHWGFAAHPENALKGRRVKQTV